MPEGRGVRMPRTVAFRVDEETVNERLKCECRGLGRSVQNELNCAARGAQQRLQVQPDSLCAGDRFPVRCGRPVCRGDDGSEVQLALERERRPTPCNFYGTNTLILTSR